MASPETGPGSRQADAVAAAVAVARSHGLTVTEPVVVEDGPVLVVHLGPAPVLAHVPQQLVASRPAVREQLAHEVAVVAALHATGVPVVPPSRVLPPGPHLRDGWWMSFWTHVPPDGSWEPDPGTASAMLAELHAALRRLTTVLTVDLPVLGPAVRDVPCGLAGLDGLTHLLGDADVAAVRERAVELLGFARDPGGTPVPLHGDPHPARLVPARGGLLWTGFGEVCAGPVEWDLVPLHWLDRWSGAAAVAANHTPDPDLLALCSGLRALHVIAAAALVPGTYSGAADRGTHLRTVADLLLGR